MTTQNTQDIIKKTIIQTTETTSKTPTLTADLAATAGIHDLATFNAADLSGMSDEVKQALFLSLIGPKRHNRGGQNGAGTASFRPFSQGAVSDEFKNFYTPEELLEFEELKGTERDIEGRMKVKITDYYMRLALKSEAIRNLVKARAEETMDLSGEVDPSNQNKFSPAPGALHKYEMMLFMVSSTCSSHCRYCYRLDLFTQKTGKTAINPDEFHAHINYIKTHNAWVEENKGFDRETGKRIYPIREALLSGGDPLALMDKRLATFMVGLAQAGIEQVRIGTKELAFFPERVDSDFFAMLDGFHKLFPRIRVVFAVHFTHPDEFLEKSEDGNYVKVNGRYVWMETVRKAVEGLTSRGNFISLENQTPIIADVNDDAKALHILQRELYSKGIGNHYLFQCREIEGHRLFAVPVETAWRIYTESQRGLSGVEKQARYTMSTEYGKMEVIGVTNGTIIFKVLRAPSGGDILGNIIVAKSNPDALWISGYMDRIISDDTGLLLTKKS
ncbi:hypothetical protein EBR57_00320 [bacterium]|nr:hypothetical protein [bacterium]